jgi:hypothetical protein
MFLIIQDAAGTVLACYRAKGNDLRENKTYRHLQQHRESTQGL